MRKTKIICTIGPSCDNEKTLKAMLDAGMNVARLNFSHGTHEEHQAKYDLLDKIRNDTHKSLGILLDTKGPEYRIGTFENKKETLAVGDIFTFTTDDIVGNNKRVSVSYKNLAKELGIGDTILVNNGILIFKVIGLEGNDIVTEVVSGGEISDRKSMSFPNKVLKQVYLSEQDKKDLLWGIKNKVDFIACSFVSCAQDMRDVSKFLADNGADDICGMTADLGNSYTYTVEEDCDVVIECDNPATGKNYFYYIDIIVPAKAIKENTKLTFGTEGNYATLEGFEVTAEVNNNGNNNAQLKNGNIKFTVAAGAKVIVYGNWAVNYKINGTTVSGMTADLGNAYELTVTEETEIVIECDPGSTGKNYFYWVEIQFAA